MATVAHYVLGRTNQHVGTRRSRLRSCPEAALGNQSPSVTRGPADAFGPPPARWGGPMQPVAAVAPSALITSAPGLARTNASKRENRASPGGSLNGTDSS